MLKAQVVSVGGVEVMPITEAIERYGADMPDPFSHNQGLMPELQRFPRLIGLLGPMWSGTPEIARYETNAMYKICSY